MSQYKESFYVELLGILQKLIIGDPVELIEAQNYMDWIENNQFDVLILELSKIVENYLLDEDLRNQAGLQLQRIIFMPVDKEKVDRTRRWQRLSVETKKNVKTNCFSALDTQEQGFNFASKCVAYIMCLEKCADQWSTDIEDLLSAISKDEAPESFKLGCLEVLRYILKEIDPDRIADQSSEVLAAIACGLKEEETDTYVKRAAATALLHSLEFTIGFFSENERVQIMELVCENIENPDNELAVTSFKCLLKMVRPYNGDLDPDVNDDNFSSTYDAIKHNEDEIVMAGISFWTDVCEKELKLALQNESKNYARGASNTLVPLLVNVLARRKEGDGSIDDAEDEWNPYMAAEECLSLLSQTCPDVIVDLVQPYVLANINHEDFGPRYAALTAVGNILEGPPRQSLKILVDHAIIGIMGMLSNGSPLVQDAAAWTVGRISRLFPEVALNSNYLQDLLEAMVVALTSKTKIALNVCWSLCSLAKGAYKLAFNGQNEPETYQLSPYFDGLVDHLLITTDRSDYGETRLQGAAYCALMVLLKYAPQDCYGCIQRTTILLLDKIQSFLEVQSYSLDIVDEVQLADIEIHLCGNLKNIISRSTQEDVLKITDKIMAVLIIMIKRTQTFTVDYIYPRVQKDALLVVSALIDSIGIHFSKYLPEFMDTFISSCLTNVTEYEIWINPIGVIRLLTRIMPLHMKRYLSTLFKYMDPILKKLCTDRSLLPLIKSVHGDCLSYMCDRTNRSWSPAIKNLKQVCEGEITMKLRTEGSLLPLIIYTYGDFAMYFGDYFRQYRVQVLKTIQQICEDDIKLENICMVNYMEDIDYPNMERYLNSLRGSCLDAFKGLIQGGRGATVNENMDRLTFIIPSLNLIFQFLEHVIIGYITSDELEESCLELVIYIISTFGQHSVEIVDIERMYQFLLSIPSQRKKDYIKKLTLQALNEIKKLKEGAPIH